MHALSCVITSTVSQLSSLMHKDSKISLINLETTLKPGGESPRGCRNVFSPLTVIIHNPCQRHGWNYKYPHCFPHCTIYEQGPIKWETELDVLLLYVCAQGDNRIRRLINNEIDEKMYKGIYKCEARGERRVLKSITDAARERTENNPLPSYYFATHGC